MSTSPPTSGKGRAIAARILTVVALVLSLVGAIAFYLERTVLDEDGFETIATEMIRPTRSATQVAATAVEQLYANVDVEQAIAERLPEAQKALAPVLAGIARQGAEEAANRLLERPRLQEAWVRVATATQRQLVELLDDEGEFVSTTGGGGRARPAADHHRARRAGRRSSARIAEQLPESTGQIAIVSSDQLETAQTGRPDSARPRELALARRASRSPPWPSGSRVAVGASSSGRSRSGWSWSGCLMLLRPPATRARTSSTR